MTSGLAGFRDGTPERFDPASMGGQLVEAEHLARYWWAAGLAAGRTVLDAGCGVGYGSAAMAAAGARRVVGIDLAAPVLEAVGPDMPPAVELHVADVRELPFDDDTFDLITCFEVIEHVEERDRVLDELARVATRDALVLVSSPNRDVYVPGNPHHVHEYLPEELRAALAGRFANVALLRQYAATASFMLPDELLGATGPSAIALTHVGKLNELAVDSETYTVAVASDSPLPQLPPALCLTEPTEVRAWVERFKEQAAVLADQADALNELRALTEQRRALTDELRKAEQKTAGLADARQAVADAAAELDDVRARHSEQLAAVAAERQIVEDDLQRARAALHDMTSSFSWRLTKPLRTAKQQLRGR